MQRQEFGTQQIIRRQDERNHSVIWRGMWHMAGQETGGTMKFSRDLLIYSGCLFFINCFAFIYTFMYHFDNELSIIISLITIISSIVPSLYLYGLMGWYEIEITK